MTSRQGGTPRVFVHVGEPKTGTTFLQQVMWTNQDELARQGLLLPGPRLMAHWRAAQDLREVPQLPNDPAGPNKGAWDRLVRQALRAPDQAVISHELLAAASAEQAERGIRSLAGAEVHVVLTVRDMGTLLPAEWQETVKHRNTRAWEDWLADVIDHEAVAADRREFWFWRVHDTLDVLRVWSTLLPPQRVHVITMPPRGAPPDLLWQRFAGLLDIDPAVADTARARANASLGLAEVELLRRLNAALPDELPGWFYMHRVKDNLAHGSLAARPSSLGRLELPPERHAWAVAHAESLIGELRASGYDIVGDPEELRPQPVSPQPVRPADVTSDEMLDAAMTAMTTLLGELGKTQGLGEPGRVPSVAPGGGAPADSAPATSAGGAPARLNPLKSRFIELSQRNATVFRVRRAYWHAANAARNLRAVARAGSDRAAARRE